MFWRFGGYATVSAVDAILEKSDFTLEELLEESDLIQELKAHNTKLIEYLREEPILERLLNYVVVAPKAQHTASADGSEGKDEDGHTDGEISSATVARIEAEDEEDEKEKKSYRYAYVAAEILSSDSWSLSAALLENTELLRKFWDFLKLPPPLDPLQSSYFTKVNEALLDKKTEEMLEFFKSIDGVVKHMLQHVDSPMIMDLLLKIISLEKQPGGEGIVDVSLARSMWSCRNDTDKATVAIFPGLDAYSPFVLRLRTLMGHADLCRRLSKGHHHHFRERLAERAVMYRSE